ncbi:Addiction module component, CHP02574 [Candidatus Magnetoovum chiemensis]|nr:Addiction module component, CHP02574 [Candidatus Magnetoovum chiemensis]
MGKFTAADTLCLPIQERIQLVEDIWDTIAAEGDAVELTEDDKRIIDERLEKYRKNPEIGSSWESVINRITNKQ